MNVDLVNFDEDFCSFFRLDGKLLNHFGRGLTAANATRYCTRKRERRRRVSIEEHEKFITLDGKECSGRLLVTIPLGQILHAFISVSLCLSLRIWLSMDEQYAAHQDEEAVR